MALSVFDDKSKKPSDSDLVLTLKDQYKLWNELKSFVLRQYPSAVEEWDYSGKNYGWGVRIDVTGPEIVADLKKLIFIKLKN